MHHFSFSAYSISIYQYYIFFSRWNCVFACELKSKIRCDMHPNADSVRRQQIHLAANWEKQLQLRAPALGWDSEIGWIIYIFRAPLPFADRFQSGKKYSTLTSEQMRICVALPCPTGLHAGNLSLIGESREQGFFIYVHDDEPSDDRALRLSSLVCSARPRIGRREEVRDDGWGELHVAEYYISTVEG